MQAKRHLRNDLLHKCQMLVTRTGAFATLKEKHLRIDVRIFPNPMGSSYFPCGVTKQQKSTGHFLCFLLVTLTVIIRTRFISLGTRLGLL